MILVSSLAAIVPTQPIAQIESLEYATPEGDQLLYIIRHGESTSNVPDPDTGLMLTSGKSLNIALTEKGKSQGTELGKLLASKIKENAEVVICSSTALRAQQTAQAIFDVLNKKHSCELDTQYEGFCELGQGIWEGQPKVGQYIEELNAWEKLSAKHKVTSPKVSTAESYEDVTKRYLPDLQTIVQKHPNKIVLIVSHHAAINAMVLKVNQVKLSEEPESKLPSIALANCDMVVMKAPLDGTMDKAQVITHIKCGLEKDI